MAACSDRVEGGPKNQGHWRELTDGWIMGNLKAFGACDQRNKSFQVAAVGLQYWRPVMVSKGRL